jgi:L-asparaginase II
MGAMTKAPPVLARVYRGSHVESVHRGCLAVVDEKGRLLEGCGDPDLPVFARSAAKPFQAMPLLLAGGEKRFDLGDAEIALICASHGGEPRHVQVARRILRSGGFRPDDLRCGVHSPMDEASARELVRRGEKPTALHNNCSGKHAGLLLACRALGLSHTDYTEPGHALQRRIRTLIARYADIQESRITVVAGRLPGEEARAAAVRARIVRALTKRPDMVAGTGRFTTEFIEAGRGRWIAKEGAEGVYAVGLRAAARGGKAIGIAFKIEDGSARPRDAVTLSALDRLGALPLEARRALAGYAEPRIHNALGLEVGRVEADVPIDRGGRRRRTDGGARQPKR